MRPMIALRLLPLAVFALAVSGCGSAAETAAPTPTAAPSTSSAASSASPTASPKPKTDAELVQAALVSRLWTPVFTITWDKPMPQPGIVACDNRSVIPRADEPKTSWQLEWSLGYEGFGQTMMSPTKASAASIIKKLTSMEKGCPSYTVDGHKTTYLAPKQTLPSMGSLANYVSCGKTTDPGQPDDYQCGVRYGTGHLFGSVYAFAQTQQRAEELLIDLMELAPAAMLKATGQA